VPDGSPVLIPHDHAVHFYDRDNEIAAAVARFVAEGLAHGDRIVVVATATHREALDEVLLQHGADAVRARISGRYLTLDADETLAKFMVQGMPDVARFVAAIGPVIDAATEDGCPVRVFGEMVALLWDEGNVAGAVELESLWNSLATTRRFSLLCAYPASSLAEGSLYDAKRVCELHSEVVPPRSYLTGVPRFGEEAQASRRSDVLVPVPAAVPIARRFVARVLRSWGEDALLADARLVTSELASNAITHAASPFRVQLGRSDSVVRISIEDVGPARPRRRTAASDDFSGRGLAIVEQLAEQWGCDMLPDGKTVWVEFGSRRASRS
jgi:anti-sigma regulatory factor (Ser/Thr protein kinase)